METHGVASCGLPTMPTPNELKPYQGFPLQSVVEWAIKYLPFLGFFLIWAAVQFKDVLKGDFTDRSQVRKKEREDAAFAKLQAREDDKILGLQRMVINNMDDGALPAHCSCMHCQHTAAACIGKRAWPCVWHAVVGHQLRDTC
jgi:hypothetical protein